MDPWEKISDRNNKYLRGLDKFGTIASLIGKTGDHQAQADLLSGFRQRLGQHQQAQAKSGLLEKLSEMEQFKHIPKELFQFMPFGGMAYSVWDALMEQGRAGGGSGQAQGQGVGYPNSSVQIGTPEMDLTGVGGMATGSPYAATAWGGDYDPYGRSGGAAGYLRNP